MDNTTELSHESCCGDVSRESYVIRRTDISGRSEPGRYVLVDRDGVINSKIENGYVRHPEQLLFLPGSLAALAKLNAAGYRVAVISNQSGISRGLYTIDDLDLVTDAVIEAVESAGGKIDAFYYCPHRDEDKCMCRKPKPGLIERAVAELGIEPTDTYMIGDSAIDVAAGQSVGCKTIFITETASGTDVSPTHVVPSLTAAVSIVLDGEGREISGTA